MKEYSVFISYRKIDGAQLASWIYQHAMGRSFVAGGTTVVVSAQLDHAFPAAVNWKDHLREELENAGSLVIVCSPATMYEERGEDWFHYEISWWAEHRMDRPPILVASKGHGCRYVPYCVRDRWPDLQIAEIGPEELSGEKRYGANRSITIFDDAISASIYRSLQAGTSAGIVIPGPGLIENIPGIFVWEKDRYGRYVYANELYARAAGYDSPQAMLGKTDHDMPWRSLARFFLEGDRLVMTGRENARIGIREQEIMVDRVADIIVHEGVCRDHTGRVLGICGCFFDVTGGTGMPVERGSILRSDETGIYLGAAFDGLHLTPPEVTVLRAIIKGVDRNRLCGLLGVSRGRLRSVIRVLKRKLQCGRDEDILTSAIRSGLPLEYFYGQ